MSEQDQVIKKTRWQFDIDHTGNALDVVLNSNGTATVTLHSGSFPLPANAKWYWALQLPASPQTAMVYGNTEGGDPKGTQVFVFNYQAASSTGWFIAKQPSANGGAVGTFTTFYTG